MSLKDRMHKVNTAMQSAREIPTNAAHIKSFLIKSTRTSNDFLVTLTWRTGNEILTDLYEISGKGEKHPANVSKYVAYQALAAFKRAVTNKGKHVAFCDTIVKAVLVSQFDTSSSIYTIKNRGKGCVYAVVVSSESEPKQVEMKFPERVDLMRGKESEQYID